jgi:hypothetical protein
VELSSLDASWSDLDFDSNYSASAVAGDYWKIAVPTASLDFVDKEGVAAFQLLSGSSAHLCNFSFCWGSIICFYCL